MGAIAQLGSLSFDVMSMTEMDATFGEDYAEHARIHGKPRLQHIGSKLDGYNISARFHRQWCDPDSQVDEVYRLMRSGESQAFVTGAGVYKGDFVITDMRVTHTQAHGDGSTWSATVSMTLKESVNDLSSVAITAMGIMTVGGAVPPGAISNVGGIVQPPSFFGMLKDAVNTGRQVFAAARTVSGVIDTARAFKSNPLAALERLRGGIAGFDKLAVVADKFGVNLAPLQPVLADAGSVLASAGVIAGQARAVGAAVAGADVANLSTVMDTATACMGRISREMSVSSTPLARLSAKVMTREVI